LERQFSNKIKFIIFTWFATLFIFSPLLGYAITSNTEEIDDYDDETYYEQEIEDDLTIELPARFDGSREGVAELSNGMIDGHRLVATNENLKLFLLDETLSIIVRNRQTGAVLYSTVDTPDPSNNIIWQNFSRSGVIIEFLTDNHVHPTRVTLLEPDVQNNVTLTNNGFRADVYFPHLEIGYSLFVELTDTGIIADVPDAYLIETGDNLISGLYIFPFLGYTHLGSREGYMFIPDGSGALIYLQYNNRRFSQPFRGKVFGENMGITLQSIPTLLRGRSVVTESHNVLIPVFGMVHTDIEIGFLGIIEGGGEFNAVIEAYPNGAITNYDWITARFVYRQSFMQSMGAGGGALTLIQNERNVFDARIRFEIVTEDDANYTGLARSFREYLLSSENVVPTQEDFRVRLDFLGLEQESGMFFNRNVVMTTVDDIANIRDRLQIAGVENILGIYRGWQHGGLTVGTLNRSFRTASVLGGNRDLTRLLRDLENTNMDLYLFADPLRISASVTSTLRFSAIRQINRQIFEEVVYQPVVGSFNFLQPSQVENIFRGFTNSIESNNVERLLIGGISNNVFSHRTGNVLNGRTETAEVFESLISNTNESVTLLLEQPFSFLWAYTNAFINAPVRGSNYVFTSREVPFLAITLRGTIPLYSEPVNFEANQREFFLQLVEQGVRPTFYITNESPELLKHTNSSHIFTSEFDRFEERIVAYYHELREIYELTLGATIERHERINDLAIVEYSNGIIIYINFSNQSRVMSGYIIEPMSYRIGGTR